MCRDQIVKQPPDHVYVARRLALLLPWPYFNIECFIALQKKKTIPAKKRENF